MEAGLIHSCDFIWSGRGRYHMMFSYRIEPPAHTVS